MGLSTADKALIRLFMAATFHHWKVLPELARSCYKAGAKVAEVRGCIRHLIVVSGYGPCLAATNHLHAAQLLAEDTPGKIQGEPGNAFELVYGDVTAAVRKKLHMVDPVLAEYIRLHLYGDIYSSPGLDLRQKQLLMVAFLAEADMHEQLFGHLIAAMKFHVTKEECLKSIDIGFELSPRVASEAQNMVYKSALKTLELAYRKIKKDYPDGFPDLPSVSIPDSKCLRIPASHPMTPVRGSDSNLFKSAFNSTEAEVITSSSCEMPLRIGKDCA